MPRRMLFIAYYFPPIGGGGVQRSTKFVRYLPEFGVEPIVVTGSGLGQRNERWSPRDDSLLQDVGPDTRILRVPGPEPPTPTGWLWRAERLLGRTSPFERWWRDGVTDLGLQAGAEVDVIFGEIVPYSTALPAANLARRLGKPWIADLQDPWALDEMWVYPTGVHRRRDRRLMHSLLSTTAGIVMNTPEAVVRLLAAFPDLKDKIVVSIPNGFDAADFEAPVAPRSDGAFRILHAGYLHTERAGQTTRLRRALGGLPVPGVDFLARSHVYLLQAIERLLAADPQLASTIEVHLVGIQSDADRAVSARSPIVREHGYCSHGETLELVRTADLLFLPMQDLPAGTRAGLVPGKTYEYLASGRPILAAVPEGDARELVTEAGTALVCAPRDVERMAELIAGAVERWRRGGAPPEPRGDVLARYERRAQTEQLAEVVERVARSAMPARSTREARRRD